MGYFDSCWLEVVEDVRSLAFAKLRGIRAAVVEPQVVEEGIVVEVALGKFVPSRHAHGLHALFGSKVPPGLPLPAIALAEVADSGHTVFVYSIASSPDPREQCGPQVRGI